MMAQQLGALAGLSEDLGSIPNTEMVAHNCLQLFQGFLLPPGPLQVL